MIVNLKDVTSFPAACARVAARAALEVLDGRLPAVGEPDGTSPRVALVSLDADGEVRVFARAPFAVGEDLAHCLLVAQRDEVLGLYGLTSSGYRYTFWHLGPARVWAYASDNDIGAYDPVDIGSRHFIPALAEWADAHGVEVGASIRATAEAAAREFYEACSGGE